MMLYREVVGYLKDKHDLTRKEAEVLAEIVISGPNKETVALKLDIAPSTAYLHFKRIYEKMQVDGMSQLYYLVLQTYQRMVHEKNQAVNLRNKTEDEVD